MYDNYADAVLDWIDKNADELDIIYANKQGLKDFVNQCSHDVPYLWSAPLNAASQLLIFIIEQLNLGWKDTLELFDGDDCRPTLSFSGYRDNTADIVWPANGPLLSGSMFKNTQIQSITVELSNKPISKSLYDEVCCDCAWLKTADIGEGFEQLGKDCFYGCTSLTKVTLPSTLDDIGRNCFYHCTSLTDIVLPDGLRRIQDQAFIGCDSLKVLEVPQTLRWVGPNAIGATVKSPGKMKIRVRGLSKEDGKNFLDHNVSWGNLSTKSRFMSKVID